MSAVAEPPTQTEPQPQNTGPAPVPNKWCIIRGTPGTNPLTIIGPFDTAEEADSFEFRDTAESNMPSTVDPLIDPANC